MLRRHQAAGPGTATWLPELFFFPAGGCETWSLRQTRSRKSRGCDPRLARPRPRSQPACRSRGPELRPPPARRAASSLLLARLLARSLARSLPRAGSALTPPHAAAAAGRWRGTTAARCWMKSSRPSSSTISLTRRYCQLGTQARDESAEPRGCSHSCRGNERSGGRTGVIGGSGCRAPPSTCLVLRSVTGVASCRSPAHTVALGDTARAT